jgi:hypothetical protein
MFNHSRGPPLNVLWTRDIEADCITYTALRNIAEGEELCISYGSGKLWFEVDDAGKGADELGEGEDYDAGQTLGELELSGLGRMAFDLDD